jgi:hypothetical protein
MRALRWIFAVENSWDAARLRRASARPPGHFRIESYGAHGSCDGVVVRGRVVDDPPLSAAVDGEGVWTAVRRSVRGFLTDELPEVPLRVVVGGTEARTRTDSEGYFLVRLAPGPLDGSAVTGSVELAGDYRGVTEPHTTPIAVHVPPRMLLSASSPTSTTRSSRPVFQRVARWSSRRSPAPPSRGSPSPVQSSSTAT